MGKVYKASQLRLAQDKNKLKKFKDWQDRLGYALLSRGIIEGFPKEGKEEFIIAWLTRHSEGPLEDIKEFAKRYSAGESFKPEMDWTK